MGDFFLLPAAFFVVLESDFTAVFFAAGDQFELSTGAWILIAALAIEVAMTISSLIVAFTKETFDTQGITVTNVFGSKSYAWKDLERFEILWDYKGRRMVKKEEIDAPYILLKFADPRKTIRLDYREDIDQCIRINYGQPHVDNWTNIGK